MPHGFGRRPRADEGDARPLRPPSTSLKRLHMNPLDLAGYGPVIPVIVIDRLEDAVPMARALVAGGVRVLEVTLRTPAGLHAIEAIAKAVPEVIIGAGTVRNAVDARAAHGAGARFIVSPGYTPEVGSACRGLDIALLRGRLSRKHLMMAAGDGLTCLR